MDGNRTSRRLAFLLAGLLAAAGPAAGQDTARVAVTVTGRERPVVGVALSGGGARGFAHIGALAALEEMGVPVDVVAGTSMGSIIGGLYAIGYTPAQLRDVVLGQDWLGLFSDSAPNRLPPLFRRALDRDYLVRVPLRKGRPALPTGLARGQRIATLLSRLTLPVHAVTDFRRLPLPFAAVVTDLDTGEGVRLERGSLPQAMRASAAFPSALSPVVIDGRTYIDGGVARNLPAEDARALGADVVVCIDAGEGLLPAGELASFVDILGQAVMFQNYGSQDAQRAACDVYVAPGLDGVGTFDFAEADTVIAAGRTAVREARAALAAFVYPGVRAEAGRAVEPDTLVVDAVRIEGASSRLARRLPSILRIDAPGPVTPGALQAGVERLYGTGLFEQVTFHVAPDSATGRPVVVVTVTERENDEAGLSLRYESRYKAALLVSARLMRGVGFGAVLEPSVRLGEVPRVSVAYLVPLPAPRLSAFLLDGRWTRYPFDRFEDGARTTQLVTDAAEARARAATVLTRTLTLTGGVWAEYYATDRRIAQGDFFNEADRLFGATAELFAETPGDGAFPATGHRFQLKARAAPHPAGSTAAFARVVLDVEARRRLHPRLAVVARLAAGHAAGDVPLHYRFYLGGTTEHGVFEDRLFPLHGYSTQQLSGTDLQALWLGAQYRLTSRWSVLATWNAGRATDGWHWGTGEEPFEHGFGLTLGGETFVLPVEVTLATRDPLRHYTLQLSLGYRF